MKKPNNQFFNKIKNKLNLKTKNIILQSKKLILKKEDLIKNIKSKKIDTRILVPSLWIQNLQDRVVSLLTNESYNVLLKQSQFYTRTITWVLMLKIRSSG